MGGFIWLTKVLVTIFPGNFMSQKETLGWDDVLPAAKVAFNIWVGEPKLRWAKEAWEHITRVGLADYTTELEYHRACIRFLVLASLYYDWNHLVWQETHPDDEILEATEYFEIDPFRLGQLIGPNESMEVHIYEELIDFALIFLMDHYREEVVKALVAGYGGKLYLMIALWNSDKKYGQSMIREPWELSYVNVGLDDAYSWVMEGCYPISERPYL